MADLLAASLQEIDLEDTKTVEDPQKVIQDLLGRCQALYAEVEQYIAAVDANQKGSKLLYSVEYKGLRNDFKSELAFLTKIQAADMSAEKSRNYTSCSNLLYHEALWATAKRCTGLVAFRKYFFWKKERGIKGLSFQKGLNLSKSSLTKGKSAALVDIVAAEGTEWVRVSTTSEKRLLFDLAKLGWQNDSDSNEDMGMTDAQNGNWEEDDDEDQVDIVKSARDLAHAAHANPTRGRPPQVRFVLTRIQSGKLKEVDAVLDKMRATGIQVECANELPQNPPSLDSVLPDLLVNPARSLSETLNLDCTILLALISDISHAQCPILDWYPSEVRAQIQDEENEKLLPTHLYPAIGSHPMVCTEEAAAQMNLIVDTLATDQEKTRANILLAQRSHNNIPSPDLLAQWASLSTHRLPPNFQLPVRVVPSNLSAAIAKLPWVATKIAKELSPLNNAIFFYGWAEGITTLSSNRTRAKQIEHAINEHGLEDGEAGPHIWLCGESRSLIAKQGRRR
ncbi:hypothetical protein K458DRAFT_479382 [Lentithecium fluviatile CBS 122367]|uniref:DUF1308 domain-containing protein n=1 Tax=Lentithecium fluviatile CBS 122367 TaxID=1168545 RepID=A0A6G1IU42_9PLEO|nr:hypothetical protein K458DRAFT_479382 [Lentithecium fluviatile CBS 122367]